MLSRRVGGIRGPRRRMQAEPRQRLVDADEPHRVAVEGEQIEVGELEQVQ